MDLHQLLMTLSWVIYLTQSTPIHSSAHLAVTEQKQAEDNSNNPLKKTSSTGKRQARSILGSRLAALKFRNTVNAGRSVGSGKLFPGLNAVRGPSYPMLAVKISDGSSDGEEIQVAMQPEMSVYDTLVAAKTVYSYTNSHAVYNPFMLELIVLEERRCAVIRRLGSITGTWDIRITDTSNNNRVLHDDICIPRRSHMFMRPGYKITLILKTDE